MDRAATEKQPKRMPRLKTEETTTLNLRLPVRLNDHIGESAKQLGITRTEYVLSWLPDTHLSKAPTPQDKANGNHR